MDKRRIEKEITQKEIREATGLCRYCDKNKVDWFCSDCWWGLCDECMITEDGTWDDCCQECLRKDAKPLGDISIFEE